jgi:translocator protein
MPPRAAILAFSLALPLAAGLIGSVATTPAIGTWYAVLNKPVFNPPNWIFGPVWTALYLLMGISLYRIWALVPARPEARPAVTLFVIHLAVNALWSIAFFGFKSPGLALLIIITLLGMITVIIKKFYRLDRAAAYLLFPYLAWVGFATLLNFAVWQLN